MPISRNRKSLMKILGTALCASLLAAMSACGGGAADSSPADGSAGNATGSQNALDGGAGTGTDLTEVEAALDGIRDRLDGLEHPKPCEGKACPPSEGFDQAVAAYDSILDALCKHEIDCCDANELNYRLGPSIRTVAQCKATFLDLVHHGYTPDFLKADGVASLIDVITALNDPHSTSEIDPQGVAACAASLTKATCVAETAPATDAGSRCPAQLEAPQYPCSLDSLLRGTGEEGASCGARAPACGEGFTCRSSGLCGMLASEGDRCLDDGDCDALYCNLSTGTCQQRGKVGEPCAYFDPSFAHVAPTPFTDPNSALLHQCETGLMCEPASKQCIESCQKGSFCRDNADCTRGLVCRGVDPALPSSTPAQCGAPVKSGKPCLSSEECESGVCGLKSEGTAPVCIAPKKLGAWCESEGHDPSCASQYCDGENACAEVCCTDSNCPTTTPFGECSEGRYCDSDSWLYAGFRAGLCRPLVDLGEECSLSDSCASGYCRYEAGSSSGICADRAVLDGPCPSGGSDECQLGQYCGTDLNCHRYALYGEDCSEHWCAGVLECAVVDDAGSERCYSLKNDLEIGMRCEGDYQCASDYCELSTSGGTCAKRVALGAACNPSNSNCETGTYCAHGGKAKTGTCVRRKSVGMVCDPKEGGSQCLGWAGCELSHGAFVCGGAALEVDTALCDGK